MTRTRRLLRRLDDFNTDHTYITAGVVGAFMGFLGWYL